MDNQSEKHLSENDYERYLETGDLSTAYLQWYDAVGMHVNHCEQCAGILDQYIEMDEFCENISIGLRLLHNATDIRRRYVAAKLMCSARDYQRKQALYALFGGQKLTGSAKWIFSPVQLQAGGLRGNFEDKGKTDAKIETKIQGEKLYVLVYTNKPQMIIFANQKIDQEFDPIVGYTEWSEEYGCQLAVMDVPNHLDIYDIYAVDLDDA